MSVKRSFVLAVAATLVGVTGAAIGAEGAVPALTGEQPTAIVMVEPDATIRVDTPADLRAWADQLAVPDVKVREVFPAGNLVSAQIPVGTLSRLRSLPHVKRVIENRVLTLDGVAPERSALEVSQKNAGWNLDRLDQRSLPLNGSYDYTHTGADVRVYIVDSGIRRSHQEFSRVTVAPGVSFVPGEGTNDCHLHGTHVAGTVAGATYGVAKQATIVPVRIFDCKAQSTTEQYYQGLEWLLSNLTLPAVVNFSMGEDDPKNELTKDDEYVNALISKGAVVVSAAGNKNADACVRTPARIPGAITVGATDSGDKRASFSNVGRCVDLFAPGHLIRSAGIRTDNESTVQSGTSMATPLVSGVVAAYLQGHPKATVEQATKAIIGAATAKVVGQPGPQSPNLLIYSNPRGWGKG